MPDDPKDQSSTHEQPAPKYDKVLAYHPRINPTQNPSARRGNVIKRNTIKGLSIESLLDRVIKG